MEINNNNQKLTKKLEIYEELLEKDMLSRDEFLNLLILYQEINSDKLKIKLKEFIREIISYVKINNIFSEEKKTNLVEFFTRDAFFKNNCNLDVDTMKYFTLGWYIYEQLLKNNNRINI